MKIIKRYGYLILISVGCISLLIVIPIIINMLADKVIFSETNGQFNSWLGFWGSYIGGILSGLLTLGGVFLGLRHERNYSLFTRYYSNTRQYEDFLNWVEDMKRISTYTEINKEILENVIESMVENETEKIIEGISRVDLEMYQLGRDIEYAMGWLSIHFDIVEKDDEQNKKYAKKEIIEEVGKIQNKANAVERRNQAITKIVNRYR